MSRINVFSHNANGTKTLTGWFDDDKTSAVIKSTTCCNEGDTHAGNGRRHENLICTAAGRWVHHTWRDRHPYASTDDEYTFLTDEQAKTWLMRHQCDSSYVEHFGKVPAETGPGRPEVGAPVHVRLGDLLPQVDEWAASQGLKNRAEAVRRLVAAGLAASAL